MSWYSDTLLLLKNRPASLTFADISEATGIKESWLKLFSRGKTENASIKTVQKLNDYLKSIKG